MVMVMLLHNGLKKLLYKIEMLLLILLIVAFYFIPLDYIESRSFCIFYNLWGIKCCGCGLTRAFFNLLHLNIGVSLSYNWLILFFFPLMVYVYIKEMLSLIDIVLLNKRDNSFLIGILCKIIDLH